MAGVSEELARLVALRDQGVLSEEQFERQKATLLDGATATTTPKKKSHTVRNGALGCVGLLVLLIIIASLVGGKTATAPAGNADGAAKTAVATPPLKVDAAKLARAYQNNEARAQSDYGDRPLLVSGTVAGVSLDIADDPKVELRTDNQFLNAQASLIDADKPKAKDFDKGQKVTLLCQGVSEVISIPMLKECAVR